jgi:hypothetical protein
MDVADQIEGPKIAPAVGPQRTALGRKCRRAKVDLPEPVAPISTTSDISGSAIFMGRL